MDSKTVELSETLVLADTSEVNSIELKPVTVAMYEQCGGRPMTFSADGGGMSMDGAKAMNYLVKMTGQPKEVLRSMKLSDYTKLEDSIWDFFT